MRCLDVLEKLDFCNCIVAAAVKTIVTHHCLSHLCIVVSNETKKETKKEKEADVSRDVMRDLCICTNVCMYVYI